MGTQVRMGTKQQEEARGTREGFSPADDSSWKSWKSALSEGTKSGLRTKERGTRRRTQKTAKKGKPPS